jgi:predicted dehydrogenase/threonine dehydrogenase-like Zn-dependent dehydrogenase
MKQIIQSYRTGEIELAEVPDPIVRQGGIILKTQNSLISIGTEKLMIGLAKKGYLGKALARPDLIKQVINKIKVDGLREAYNASMSRLDTPVTLGYSSSGIIKEIGVGVEGVSMGDRVACFGDGFATHSELSFVPKNMFVKIPEKVSFEEAAFVGLGAIALNAIRIANLTFGEDVAVIGLGLLGQLTVQMLKAFGCKVIGIDISESKAKLSLEHGCDKATVIREEDINQVVSGFTKGRGVDAVIIMAGSKDNKPVEMAAEISRDKGRIVACGMVSLDIPRQEFFKKELSVIVSRATGPGKFDPVYENKGVDYPLPYVRWTTQRNMEYFLELIDEGKVKLNKLITHRFKINNALKAYDMVLRNTEPYLGVLIEYETTGMNHTVHTTEKMEITRKIDLQPTTYHQKPLSKLGIGLIGAGLHSNTGILPTLKKFKDIKLIGIADVEGFKGRHTGKKYGAQYCVSDYQELLNDPDIGCVLIATRHNLHARMVIDALNRGKHVFVEKPLCINVEELKEIMNAYFSPITHYLSPILMVGFNRRFSPFAQKARELLEDSHDMVINCRVNAGFVPKESWVYDAVEGGGRVIGEVCHFVDLIQYLSNSLPAKVYAECTSEKGEDNLVISLKMKNGSVATILYASQGDRLLPRERIEVFSGNSVCVIDNFKSLFFARDGKSQNKRAFNLDRGYEGEFKAFFDAIKNNRSNPVNFEEYVYTTLVTFSIVESIKSGRPVDVRVDLPR